MIESINNTYIKNINKLKEKKYRDKNNLFLVEGEHLVLEAYKNKLLKEVILYDYDIDLDIKKTFVSKKVMDYISELNNNKIIGICIKKDNKLDLNKNILILDNIQDPGNLGTIIRSSVAFNINNIILSNNSVDLYNSKVLRSTQGMLFYINIVRENINNIIDILKDNNYIIYGTDVNNGIDINDVKNNKKYAIIMGNEGSGIEDSIKNKIDKNIYIKMNNNCESLNVAVSASIILYELSKR